MPLDEFSLITTLFKELTALDKSVVCGIGDDGAIVNLPENTQLVVSTDTLISDVHFYADAEPYDIGYKSLAVNLSDMAAMGAQPRWVTLSITLPEINIEWLKAFTRGFSNLAEKHQVCLIGGDTSRGPLSITCQIMGTVTEGTAICRNNAQIDDDIYVSGCLGEAALALEIMEGNHPNISASIEKDYLSRLQGPVPRVQLGVRLCGIANAMIDLSDGLAGDLGHIIKASNVGAEIELNKIPLFKATPEMTLEQQWQLALNGGDDYELCFTCSKTKREKLEAILGKVDCSATRIGRIVKGSKIKWLQGDNSEYHFLPASYQHF